MILLVVLMIVLVFAVIALVLFLWFFTGEHFYPESRVEYSAEELEDVYDPALYPACEDKEDPETFSKRREIEARDNILKLENLL